jgi:hypothetical protein
MSTVQLNPIKITLYDAYLMTDSAKERLDSQVEGIMIDESFSNHSSSSLNDIHPSQVVYSIGIDNRGTTWRQTKTLEELKEFFTVIESNNN